MARLIKAVARCGLRFESGLPLGRVQRKGSAAAAKGERATGNESEREIVIVAQQRGHIRWA